MQKPDLVLEEESKVVTASDAIKEVCDFVRNDVVLSEYVKYIPDDDWFKQLKGMAGRMDPYLQTKQWRVLVSGDIPFVPEYMGNLIHIRTLTNIINDEPVTVITKDKRPLSLWFQDGTFWSLDGKHEFDKDRIFMVNIELDRTVWRNAVAEVSPSLDVDHLADSIREYRTAKAKALAARKKAEEKALNKKQTKARISSKSAKKARKLNRK